MTNPHRMVYLSGEVHPDWRESTIQGTETADLPVNFCSPVTDHDASDDCGVAIFGPEEKLFWKDAKGRAPTPFVPGR